MSMPTHTLSTLSNMVSTIQQQETSSTKEKNVTEKSFVDNTLSSNLMAMSELLTTTQTSGDSTLMSRTQKTTFTKNKFKTFFKAFPLHPAKIFI